MATNRETRPTLSFRARIAVLAAVAGALLVLLLLVPPFAQPDSYHQFADARGWLGIPRFGDVMSNVPIGIAGLLGLWLMATPRARGVFAGAWIKAPLRVYFLGVVWIAFGSAYYHWEPSTERLYWDRLPMAVGFMALVAVFATDRIDARRGALFVLPILVIFGAACTTMWLMSERAGAGDLGIYFLVQAVIFIYIPLIAVLFAGRFTDGRALVWVGIWYGAAILCEQLDHQIFSWTGEFVSGHSLKHIFAGAAVGAIVLMIRRAINQAALAQPADSA